jgi:hypothetical protein
MPVEIRIAKFRRMLAETGACATSAWNNKLLKKIGDDERFLLLDAEERKEVGFIRAEKLGNVFSMFRFSTPLSRNALTKIVQRKPGMREIASRTCWWARNCTES